MGIVREDVRARDEFIRLQRHELPNGVALSDLLKHEVEFVIVSEQLKASPRGVDDMEGHLLAFERPIGKSDVRHAGRGGQALDHVSEGGVGIGAVGIDRCRGEGLQALNLGCARPRIDPGINPVGCFSSGREYFGLGEEAGRTATGGHRHGYKEEEARVHEQMDSSSPGASCGAATERKGIGSKDGGRGASGHRNDGGPGS